MLVVREETARVLDGFSLAQAVAGEAHAQAAL